MGIWERKVEGRLSDLERDLDKVSKDLEREKTFKPFNITSLLGMRPEEWLARLKKVEDNVVDSEAFVCRRLNHYESRIVQLEKRFSEQASVIASMQNDIADLRNPPQTYTMKCGGRIVNTWTEPPSRCSSCKFFRYSHEAKEHGCYRLSQGKHWCIRAKSEAACGYFEED